MLPGVVEIILMPLHPYKYTVELSADVELLRGARGVDAEYHVGIIPLHGCKALRGAVVDYHAALSLSRGVGGALHPEAVIGEIVKRTDLRLWICVLGGPTDWHTRHLLNLVESSAFALYNGVERR